MAASFSSSAASDETDSGSRRRKLSTTTIERWIRDNDKNLKTRTWLKYQKVDREYVKSMSCSVCTQFNDKLMGCRNYSPAFIVGSTNLRSSAFRDHGRSDMHQCAMHFLKKSCSKSIVEYAPIVRVLCSMDDDTKSMIKKQFELAYFLTKENLPFSKVNAVYELEELHGVKFGNNYRNRQSCTIFVEYIALEQRKRLASALDKVKFFSVQADGSCDSANLEEELFIVFYFNPYASDGKIHICMNFLSVRQPSRANAAGLFESFTRAMGRVEVTDWQFKLVGFGCDGAAVNIGSNGLKGYLEEHVPWVVCFWCLVHRLQLALKDALKDTLFSSIDEMLMPLYYLYEKSPKKCRELNEVVKNLVSLEDNDMPDGSANRPLRACGTRFVSHKVAALNCLIDRYGAYMSHLLSLTEDSSVKPADRQKLKGYVKKWQSGKIVLGCALFHDLLRPCATLSKILQDKGLSIVDAIEAILKTTRNVEELQSANLEELPTLKKVMSQVHVTADMVKYQGITLFCYEGMSFLSANKDELLSSVSICLKDRVKSNNLELLKTVLTLLATQGWEKSSTDFADAALQHLSERFSIPLEKAGVDSSMLQEEWRDLVDYARRYLNLVQEHSRVIWWKLFNSPSSSSWTNILSLVEILFCVPVANGHVERTFSTLKLIKSDRRSCLSEDHLDNLMRISVDGPLLREWNSDGAVQLWWTDKQRRLTEPKSSHTGTSSSVIDLTQEVSPAQSEQPIEMLEFGDWEDYFD